MAAGPEATPIELTEYGETSVALTSSQERQLRRVVEHRLAIAPDLEADRWRLQASSFVGTIVIPGMRILIRPKVSTANLFHLLEAGGRGLDVGAEQFEYELTNDLLPSFATFFARHLERALGQGVPRAYVEQHDRLSTLRGRLDLPSQQRAAGLPLPASCLFDDYTADIPLNRILRAAAVRLLRLGGVTTSTRAALRGLVARLLEVGDATAAILRTPVTFSRLNEHCRPAERLARIVLDNATLRDAPGQTGAGAFLVDMNKVFEEFVEARLRRYLADRLSVRGQHVTSLDTNGTVRIRPDLTFSSQRGLAYVADTKYKVTRDGFALDRDYYQLLAYVTALDLDEGLLIYCQDDDQPVPREVEVLHTGKRLRTWAVGLGGSVADVEAELRRLGEHIVDRVRAASVQPGRLERAS